MALQDIYYNIWNFFDLTTQGSVFWAVLPLLIVAIMTIVYYQRNRLEKVGWDSYFANSLILIFVSFDLLRYIYTLGVPGAANYIDNPFKSFAVIFLLVFGLFISRLNFSHLLPEKITSYVSSPITISLLAYMVILYVHTTAENTWELFISLFILFAILLIIFNLIKLPLNSLFDYLRKEKRKDKIKNVKEERFEIEELKKELGYREKKLKKYELREIDEEKKEDIKLEKIIRRKRR